MAEREGAQMPHLSSASAWLMLVALLFRVAGQDRGTTCLAGKTELCASGVESLEQQTSGGLGDASRSVDRGAVTGFWEPRIGRPCACQYKKPSTEALHACFDGAGTNNLVVKSSVTAGNPDSRVLAITSVYRRAESPSRFALSLSATHLAAYGHSFSVERRDDEYRNGKLQLGSLAEDRMWQVQLLLRKLRELRKKTDDTFGWLLWLDPNAAILTDRDVLRQTLLSQAVTEKTHVIICRHGNVSGALHNASSTLSSQAFDSSIILLRNAPWTEGFLTAWHQELAHMTGSKKHSDAADEALGRAVEKARGLGGDNVAIEFPEGTLSVSLREGGSELQDSIVHLRDTPDEICEHVFHAAWSFACKRPGGLSGRDPALLKRFHREALEDRLEGLVAKKKAPTEEPTMFSSGGLHLNGRELKKADHAEVVVDILMEHAPDLLKAAANDDGGKAREAARKAERLLRIAMVGYHYSFGTPHNPKGAKCGEHLKELYDSRGHRALREAYR